MQFVRQDYAYRKATGTRTKEACHVAPRWEASIAAAKQRITVKPKPRTKKNYEKSRFVFN